MTNQTLTQPIMKKSLLLFSFALALPFGAFCQTYNYAINSLNIPCIDQKGDLLLGLSWSRGASFRALEVQAVYSPMPHLAVMANYFGAPEKSVRKQEVYGTNFHLWEAGVGIYEKLPKGAASLFAGFGSGNLFSHYGLGRTADFNIQRWFLQPGLSYRSHHFQAGLALRLSHLSYHRAVVDYSIESPDIEFIQNLEKSAPMFLPELGIQAGTRLKPVTINLSISFIFPDTNEWDFIRLNSSIGVIVDIGVGKRQVTSNK